jgi:phosphonatase-like hydrolase
VKVALTTGFDRETTVSLLGSLGWDSTVVDAVVCIDDVAAGRPAPFLVFHAMEATGIADVRRVLVAGDTVRDVESGLNAGAAVVVAVRTGHVPEPTLAAAGPTHVLDGVARIPALLTSVSPDTSANRS